MSSTMFAEKKSAASGSRAKVVKAATGNLRIGPPNDYFEQEADRVADEVMVGGIGRREWSLSRMSIDAPLQRKCSCGGTGSSDGQCAECKEKEQKTLQRKAAGSVESDVAPAIVHDVLNSPGQPLDAQTRAYFEPRFGHDFSKVRVHDDAEAAESARAVNALAYTVGPNIAFDAGQYTPHSATGRRLIAHELVHTVQQRHALASSGPLRMSKSWEPAEREAQRSAAAVLQNELGTIRAGQLQLARQDAGGGGGGAGPPDAGGGGGATGGASPPPGGGAAPPVGGAGAAPPAPGAVGGAVAPRVLRVEVENSSTAITYPVPSNLGAAGHQHWVTIAGKRPDVVVHAVLDPAIPEGDPQASTLTWESDPAGGVAAGSGPLHGTVSVPKATKRVVRAKLGGSSAEMTLWGVFVEVKPSAGPTSPPTVVQRATGLAISTDVSFTGRIFPPSIITDADRPDLSGANTVHPTGTNMCGDALAGGMDHKWDMSRQDRQRNIDPAGLLPGVTPEPHCLQNVEGYPASSSTGNDDAGTADENDDPYAGGGVIRSGDTPRNIYLDAVGADGDTVEQHLQFREFARLEFHGTIWNVSNFSPWRIHYKVKRAAGKWADNGSSAAADNAGF